MKTMGIAPGSLQANRSQPPSQHPMIQRRAGQRGLNRECASGTRCISRDETPKVDSNDRLTHRSLHGRVRNRYSIGVCLLLVAATAVSPVRATQPHPGNRPEFANLVYDPESGEVVLSGAEEGSGRILSFAITSSGRTKLDFARAVLPFEDTGQNTDLTSFQIAQALDSGLDQPDAGFEAHALGKVLSPGMDLELLVATLDIAIYAGGLGSGGNFDVLLFEDLPEGDFTGDSVVEADDADVFCTAMARQEPSPAFNLVGTPLLQAADLSRMLVLGNRRSGDSDWNGQVGFSDFLRLSGNFGQRGTFSNGDSDCDGTVDFGDFLTLSGNFGTTFQGPNAETVPEPNTGLGFAGLVLFVGMRVRRRQDM